MSTKYPEHQKLKAVAERSQTVGTFLDWLRDEKGISLAVQHEHNESCHEEGRWNRCGYSAGDYVPAFASTRNLLAEFFAIDEERLEREKRAMLAEMRGESVGES